LQQQTAQRLSAARQQQLIQQQRLRSQRYSQRLAEQERLAELQAQTYQRQNRMAQYRFQQQYYEGLRQQRLNAQNWQSYNYSSDPYFYTAPAYQYTYGGRSYDTSQYGADLLQQAVNNGYQEGYLAGQADRQDGQRFDYRNSWAYRDANYGYTGMYVDQPQYNYYFQQGFQRGYEDGYYSRSQYGQSFNGKYQILATLLAQILNLRSLR
jgi:hypothetical protein